MADLDYRSSPVQLLGRAQAGPLERHHREEMKKPPEDARNGPARCFLLAKGEPHVVDKPHSQRLEALGVASSARAKEKAARGAAFPIK
jgi:hypothetical protein